jgi:hypothetical protein
MRLAESSGVPADPRQQIAHGAAIPIQQPDQETGGLPVINAELETIHADSCEETSFREK